MTQKRYTEIPKRQKCINKEEPYIGGAKDIIDDELNKPQSQVNEETNQRVSTLEEEVGPGGSVDERITVEKNRAEQAEGVLDGKIATEKQRAEGVEGDLNTRLQTVEELAEISVGGGDIGIGTAADFESDDPSDLAKVPTISAILGSMDDEPTAGSENLVKSNGIADAIVSRYISVKSAWSLNESSIEPNDYWINLNGEPRKKNATGQASSIVVSAVGQVFYFAYKNLFFTIEEGSNNYKYAKPCNNIYILKSFKQVPAVGTFEEMDYYYSSSMQLRMIVGVNSSSGSISSYANIPITEDMIFVYNNTLYRYNGEDLIPFQQDETGAKRTLILESFRQIPSNPQEGDYYYSPSKQLRLITGISASGTIYSEVIPFSSSTIYIYSQSLFMYNGTELIPVSASSNSHSIELSSITLKNVDEKTDGTINDIMNLVLCAIKFDNSRTPAGGYGEKSHPIPVGWLYYDLNNRNNIYYSFGVPDNPKLLFVWDTSISGADNEDGIMAYSVNICPNGDIVCVPKAEYFFNRNYNPIVYKHNDYENPVEVNVSKPNSTGVNVKPVGWFGNSGICTITSENCMIFGEYARPQVEPANAWKVTYPFDNPNNWNIVYATTGTGEGTREIEHFHSVCYDIFTGRLYIATGDEGNESYIMESTDDGDTWTKVYGGTSQTRDLARALNMIFTKDSCYYGSDNTAAIIRIDRDNNGILDFSTIRFVVDKYGNQILPSLDGYAIGLTYYTCLIDNPFGLLLLQYREGVSTDGILVYFYDIEANEIQIIGKLKPVGTNPCGFRCDAVNYYQGIFDNRIVTGFGIRANTNDIAGNKNNNYGNLTLKVF